MKSNCYKRSWCEWFKWNITVIKLVFKQAIWLLFNWFFFYFFDLAQAVTNGDPLQAYASMQPYAGIGKFWKK